MSFRPLLLAGGLATAMLSAALLVATPGQAQFRPDWSPWGGPDSPGGLFGGDPLDAEPHDPQPVQHDAFWNWVAGRSQQADRNRDGHVTMEELNMTPGSPGHAQREAWFRAADTNRDGGLSPEELKVYSNMVFHFHDLDRDGKLSPHEIRRRPAAAAQGAAQGASQGATPGATSGQPAGATPAPAARGATPPQR